MLTMVDEPEVQQRIDLSFGDGRLVPVVEVFQVLLQRQARLSAVAFDTAARALGNLVFRQHLSEVQMREVVRVGRSEEHTSELQSLMRNSYADFCLKKQKER